MTVFENRVLVDAIKVRSYRIRVGPNPVLVNTNTEIRWPCDGRGTYCYIATNQAMSGQPETGRRKGGFSPRDFGESMALVKTLIPTPRL